MLNNTLAPTNNPSATTVHRVTAFIGEKRTRSWLGTSPKVMRDGSLSIVDAGTGLPVIVCGSYTLEAALTANAA